MVIVSFHRISKGKSFSKPKAPRMNVRALKQVELSLPSNSLAARRRKPLEEPSEEKLVSADEMFLTDEVHQS